MAAGKSYRFIGDHAEEIVPGQFIAPGDEVKPSAEDSKDDNFKRLLDEGKLVEIEHTRKEASK